MSTKMKGLLKGLRYISQIFEEEEQEKEMEIGFPTDVKHVAHIGWDGPAANSPSWIQNFKDGEAGGPTPNVDQQNAPISRDARLPVQEKRFSTGSDSPLESPSARRRSDKAKGRRHGSAGSSVDSPRRSSSSTSESRTKLPPGPDSPSRDSNSSSKTSRRRKTKGSSKTKSTTPSADNLSYSDPAMGKDDKARRIPAM